MPGAGGRQLAVGPAAPRELDAIIAQRGRRSDTIVNDNGTDYTFNDLLAWTNDGGVGWHYIAPGQASAERLQQGLQRPAA